MNENVPVRIMFALFMFILASAVACSSPGSQPETPTSAAAPPTEAASLSPVIETAAPREHRIGVRVEDSQGEFYDRLTDEQYVPRGVNYHWLAPEETYYVDTLFSPDRYDPLEVADDFQRFGELGYNVVRTSIDLCAQDCIGDPSGGIRGEWLDNIVDFLHLARAHHLTVILTTNDLPLHGGYVPRVEAQCCEPFDGYMNTHYLSPVGMAVYRDYWREVVDGLIERGAPLDAIMAYSIRGEQFLFSDRPPLSLDSGNVTTANGQTYDMADPAQKQQMVEDGIVHWIDSVGGGIRELDPTALITIGAFAPNEPFNWRPEDSRYVPSLEVYSRSSADFLDVHLYSGQADFAQLAENFALSTISEIPVILAEFGGFKYVFHAPVVAAYGVQEWQVASCEFGIDGWMHWHWKGSDDHEVWTGAEADEMINLVLSPAHRPDPCSRQSFPFFENNLALGKPVRSSRSLPEQPPQAAVDGWQNTAWGSGDGPVGWIEIDIGTPETVEMIRLIADQFPDGDTRHQIWVAGPGEELRLLGELAGFTTMGQILEFEVLEDGENIQRMRIVTVASPSWVSWREVEILGLMDD